MVTSHFADKGHIGTGPSQRDKTIEYRSARYGHRRLVVLEQDKKISVGERRMLHNAKQILQSEIMLVKDIDAAQAEAWLKECC